MPGVILAFLYDLLVTGSPFLLAFGAFAIWMLVDAIRREEWLWVVFIFIFPFLNAPLYFFLVYRAAAPAVGTFEVPGAADRRRIKQLKEQIHHLDKAHHHSQLGDIYLGQGRLKQAEECYLAALAREPDDLDTQAHQGQCLLRQGRFEEARVHLEHVCGREPHHDYGQTLMALAETCTALGQSEAAMAAWKQVLEQHTYARARVQLAELHLARNETALARAALEEVIADDAHAPSFQRRKDRPWVRRARQLLSRNAR